jgi:glyoxylase-like metal-dependent hydrolase (beta-lactamase superfamily II)
MRIPRRTLAGLFVTLAALGPAHARPPEPKPYDIVQLAEGVYGFVWRNPAQDPIESNALFIVNDRDVVVVDAGILPSSARRMAAALRQLTSKPVRYVINTHWHDDHHQGNEVYRDLWPQVEFIAHRDTRTDILDKTYAPRAQVIADMKQQNQQFARWPRRARTTTASRSKNGGVRGCGRLPRCTDRRLPRSRKSATPRPT